MARILISMPDQFLDQVDHIAENEHRSRSELIRTALRNYINRSQTRNRMVDDKNAALLEDLLKED